MVDDRQQEKEAEARASRVQTRLALLRETFTPTQPVRTREIFAGRTEQLVECLGIANVVGLHGILYGDRGVGKTSIANMVELFGSLEKTDCKVIKIECTSTDTFEGIVRQIYARITLKVPGSSVGFAPDNAADQEVNLVDLLPDKPSFNPKDVASVLKQAAGCILVILDEFDRLDGSKFDLSSFTELMKIISDISVDAHFLVVGVGDSVDQIIGNHASVVRNLNQIKLHSMDSDEIEQIVRTGLDKLELSMTDKLVSEIVRFSCGYPHYTHLLCAYACTSAIRADSNEIDSADLAYAIGRALSRAQESVRNSYHAATMTNRSNIYKEVLQACGEAELDEYNTFVPKDVEKPLSAILKRPMKVIQFGSHLRNLCQPERGEILVWIGERGRARYRFRDPLMRAFVRLNGGARH